MHSCLNTVIDLDLAQKGLYEVMFKLNFEMCKFVSQIPTACAEEWTYETAQCVRGAVSSFVLTD